MSAPNTSLSLSLPQTVPLASFTFVMLFFGLLGNGTVMYSSLRYNSIRLDRVSLILLQNLALADILYTSCVILPQFITYVSGGWVLGHWYCVVMAQVGIVPVSANTLTVLAITSYRLKMVLNPFTSISTNHVRVGLAVIWSSALVPIMVFLGYKSKSEFHVDNGRCLSDIYDNEEAKIPVMLCVGVFVILPLFAITFFNIFLSIIAIKHHGRGGAQDKANFKALLMVCSLSGLFIVSWTPYVIFTFLKMKSTSTMPLSIDLLAFHFIFLNSFGNPILYTITNRRFGLYVKERVLKTLLCCSGQSTEELKDNALWTYSAKKEPGSG